MNISNLAIENLRDVMTNRGFLNTLREQKHKFFKIHNLYSLKKFSSRYGWSIKIKKVFSKQVVFDNTHSGAYLAWKHYFPNKEVPLLVQYVEDRDCWFWKLSDSKLVNSGLFEMLPMRYETAIDEFPSKLIRFIGFKNRVPNFDKYLSLLY